MKRGEKSPLLDIATFNQHELKVSGSCMGCRVMHQCSINQDVMLSRAVAQILKHLNDISIETRMIRTLKCCVYYRKCPNWVGYNK